MFSLQASRMKALVFGFGCLVAPIAVRANPFSTVPDVLEKTFNSMHMIPSTPVDV